MRESCLISKWQVDDHLLNDILQIYELDSYKASGLAPLFSVLNYYSGTKSGCSLCYSHITSELKATNKSQHKKVRNGKKGTKEKGLIKFNSRGIIKGI